MLLQGNLQNVFDALYAIGALDPVLKMDWAQVTKEMEANPKMVVEACHEVNQFSKDTNELVRKLCTMDKRSIHFVALEVARELCEFQERSVLH